MKKSSIVLTFIALIVISFIAINRINSEYRESSLEQFYTIQKAYTKQASENINEFFDYFLSGLDYLSKTRNIKKINADGKHLIEEFYNSHKNKIEAVTRISKEGKIIYTHPYVPEVIGKDVSYQDHNSMMMSKREPIISNIFMSVQGYRTVSVAVPIFKDSVYEGSISCLIPFDYIAEKNVKNIKIGETGYAYLIDEDGVFLSSPRMGQIGNSILTLSQGIPSALKMAENMLSEENGRVEYEFPHINTKEIVTNYNYFERIELLNTHWIIAVTFSENDLTEINRSFANNIISFFAVIASLFVLISSLFLYSIYKTGKKLDEKDYFYKLAAEQTGQLLFQYDIHKDEFNWSGKVNSIVGYSLKEFNNLTLQKFLEKINYKEHKSVQLEFEDCVSSGKRLGIDFKFRKGNGDKIYIEMKAIPKYDKSGEPSKILGTMKDITERKEVEKELMEHRTELEQLVDQRTSQLKELNKKLENDIHIRKRTEKQLLEAKENAEISEKLKSDFLAQMSHEIRTPINTILSYSSLIKMEIADDYNEDILYSFDAIDRGAQRLMRTIDLILNMSDIESGRYEPVYESLNLLLDIINPLFNEFKSFATAKKLELKLEVNKSENFNAKLDKYTVTQIFANLIDNAIKYTNQGEVTISISRKDSSIVTEITDTGIGIKEEFQPFIFEAFSQEEQGYTRKFEGNGLGLALVKQYCEINNARVSFKSEKNAGTSFWVEFPTVR